MNNLYERISALCDKRGIKPGRMCNDLGISRGNITDLKMGRIESISMDKILKISEYFSVSVDYLVGTATKKTPTPEGEREKELLSSKYFRVLQSANDKGYTPEDIQLALDFLDRARKRDEEK